MVFLVEGKVEVDEKLLGIGGYLSRMFSVNGQKDQLNEAEQPIILNASAPGVKGTVHRNDL